MELFFIRSENWYNQPSLYNQSLKYNYDHIIIPEIYIQSATISYAVCLWFVLQSHYHYAS